MRNTSTVKIIRSNKVSKMQIKRINKIMNLKISWNKNKNSRTEIRKC